MTLWNILAQCWQQVKQSNVVLGLFVLPFIVYLCCDPGSVNSAWILLGAREVRPLLAGINQYL
jgi:hypothetical protein